MELVVQSQVPSVGELLGTDGALELLDPGVRAQVALKLLRRPERHVATLAQEAALVDLKVSQ